MTATLDTAMLVGGRYRLAEVIGTGPVGTVRLAWDARLRRAVAVKLFHRADGGAIERPVNLALMASVTHPALTRVYDGDDADDEVGAYVVTEHITGPSLSQAILKGPMPGRTVAAIAADLTSALLHLHGLGFAHGNVKPTNVLLTEGAAVTAKIADFGMQRCASSDHRNRNLPSGGGPSPVTHDQLIGPPTELASDVYALGFTLLAALTGESLPPVGASAEVGDAPPMWPMLVPSISQPWRDLITPMLEPRAVDRPSVADVRKHVVGIQGDGWQSQDQRPSPADDRIIALGATHVDFATSPSVAGHRFGRRRSMGQHRKSGRQHSLARD